MKISQLLILLILLCGRISAAPEPDICFKESKKGLSTITTCTRNGVEIYKHFVLEKSKNNKYSVYTFFWNKKKALTVVTVNGIASIQQTAKLPVSYNIGLDAAEMVSIVGIERADGQLIDGLWTKNGNLYPVDPALLKVSK